MVKVPDDITLGQLVSRSAKALARAGLEHRIDIFRDVEVDDPAVSSMLGRPHKIRVRIMSHRVEPVAEAWVSALQPPLVLQSRSPTLLAMLPSVKHSR